MFDGIAQQVSLAAPIGAEPAPATEAALGPPTLTLRDAQALGPHAGPGARGPIARGPIAEAHRLRRAGRDVRRSACGRSLRAAAHDVAPGADRGLRRRDRPARALLAAQAAYHFRDSIVTFWPVTRPAFERVCELAGCTIRPLRDAAMSYLSIDASDLQADPAHRGLLILTATLRNRAGWPLAYPHLELTLTDAQDRVVVRRALAPADYAGGTADLSRGIAANGEVALKVFIDASATSQAGYRLYMFYP